MPESSFGKPSVSLYFNDSVVVLIRFSPSPRLTTDAFLTLLKGRLSSKEGISLPIYYSPFVVTKIEPPSSIHTLPPSPFADHTPPSKAPLVAAAVCGAVAAIFILWVILIIIKTSCFLYEINNFDGMGDPSASPGEKFH